MSNQSLIDFGYKNPLYPKAKGNTTEGTQMANIAEEAAQYEPPQTKNIAELDSVPVSTEVKEKEVMKEDGSTFKYKYIEHGNEEYRVPATVLKQLKQHIEANKSLKRFKVTKEGTGLNTSYTVIPL